MGDTRGIGSFGVALLTLASGSVAVLVSGSPASAAPVPCVQSFSQEWLEGPISPGRGRPINVEVPATPTTPEWTRVAKVEVLVELDSAPQTVDLEAYHGFTGGARLAEFTERASGPVSLTFDDSAPARNPYQLTGRVRPEQPLSLFVGDTLTTTGRAAWQVIVRNPSTSQGTVRPQRATFTFTLTDCDSDGDGVLDSGDNCPTTANADQTDWDGDRIGNACDASPGTAPPTPAPTTPPGTVLPPSGCSTGCAYESTIGLRHRAKRHRLTGMVDSVAVGCRSGVEVTIWRRKSGDDRKLVVVTTRQTGTFRTKAPRRPGRYYATVGTPEQPLCGPARSRVVRVRRP